MTNAPSDRIPERVTHHPDANEQLLYFTSTSLTTDDRRLVYISDHTGHPNLFDRDLVTGAERQLTYNVEGYLKSYVYFFGEPYRGFGKASVSLHASSGTIYYLQGREIRRVDADGRERTLAEYPFGQMTAFTHVSSDGTRLCVPTTDSRALDGDGKVTEWFNYNIDERVRAEGLSSWLRVYDTETGEELLCERVPACWITHVQFSPIDHHLILYNHEWPSVDAGICRMWLFDGTRHLRLRTEGDGRSGNDGACHEMWERDGSAIIYHGDIAGRGPCIGRVTPDGCDIHEIVLTQGSECYGHFTSGAPGVLVSDGYYETEEDRRAIAFGTTRGGDWISRVDADWETGTYLWTPLCRSASSWAGQDEHPHPIIDHGSRFVYFTSDRDDRRAVYRIPLKSEIMLSRGQHAMNHVSSPLPTMPSQAQQQWMELGYGLFIHFGPNTFTASGWGDGKFPAADFDPTELSTDQWAELAVAAGMQYAVLTTKHHDGLCLWPSRHTEYCTKNSPGAPDIVGGFVESCRTAGIRPGLYYSLWDRNYPRYEDDAAYADYMFAQIEELLSHYGPILELWFDGGWDKDHPTREWPYDPAWETDPRSGLTHGERWRWRELYQHIHHLQPECLVVMNSSSDRPGGIKYHPVDIRTSEHFHFIWQETVYDPVLAPVFTDPERGDVFLPLEYCTSLYPKWFWNEGDCYSHPSVETICGWYRQARANNANLLLNAGPDTRGLMPEYHLRFLAAAADELGLKEWKPI